MFSSVLLFLNIGGSEMILIVFVALLLFGGEKLPQIAKGLGKGIRHFKDASEGVKREITNQINNFEEKKTEEKMLTEYTAATEEAKALPAAEEHPVAEGEEIAVAEHTEVPSHTEAPTPVANTMPYVEVYNHTPETHINTEEHTETTEPVTEHKAEPVKTTHE